MQHSFFRQESNLIDALSVGATTTIKLIAYVVVNLIAFVAVVAFLDAVVSYMGGRVGHPELNFQVRLIEVSTYPPRYVLCPQLFHSEGKHL